MQTIIELEDRIAKLEALVKRRRGQHGQTEALLRTMRGLRTEQLRLWNDARENAEAQYIFDKTTYFGVRAL